MSNRFRVEGYQQLDKALAQFKLGTARGVLKRAGTKALEPVAKSARELAPDDPATPAPHDLKSSIIVSSRQRGSRFGKSGDLGTFVQLFVGPSGGGYPQAMVQEFGAKPHTIKPKAKDGEVAFDAGGKSVVVGEVEHPGHAPHPFMRPAWEAHRAELPKTLATLLWDEIQKTAARAAKRATKAATRAKG